MLKYIFMLVLLFAGSLISQNLGADSLRGYRVSVGQMAPDLTLVLTTGDTLQTNHLRGKVVVLQFTASWCSVCRKEMPHLENGVWLPNKNKDFVLIGIDYDEPIEKVIDFVKQMKITYAMALDPNGKHFHQFAYPKSGVTRNVVIDKTGKIAFLTRLYDKKEFEEMKTVIKKLLD